MQTGGQGPGGAPRGAGGRCSGPAVHRRPEEAGRALRVHRGRIPEKRGGAGGGAGRKEKHRPGNPQALCVPGGEAPLGDHARGGGDGTGGALCRPVSGPERHPMRGAGAGRGRGRPHRQGGGVLGRRSAGPRLQRTVRGGGRGHLLRREVDHRHPRPPHLGGDGRPGGGGGPGGREVVPQAPHRHRHSAAGGEAHPPGAHRPGVRRALRPSAHRPGDRGGDAHRRARGGPQGGVPPGLRRPGAGPGTLRPGHLCHAPRGGGAYGAEALRHRGAH